MARGHSPTETLASALVTLRGAGDADPEILREAVDAASAEMEQALAAKPHFSRTEAAELLGVSTTTLDNWIAKGLLPLRKVPDYKRERIPTRPLLALATEVKELRRMGQQRGLLAEALARLEREDPAWAEEFAELYGKEAKRPFDRDDYVSAAPGPDWDPED
jgi:DNA-binding transcriptional MerR regulator